MVKKSLFLMTFLLVSQVCCADTAHKKKSGPQKYLSGVAIFRDEAPYLKEWIEYHEMLGVEHFYLYNNLSQDNYQEVLQPYIKRGLVELVEWPYQHRTRMEWIKTQLDSYRDAIAKAKKNCTWLAIFDSDEFLVPNCHESLAAMLKDLEKKDRKKEIASYRLQWIIFGTSGVEAVPDGRLMIELLTRHQKELSYHGKCIVRPEYVKEVPDAHKVTLRNHKKMQHLPLDTAQINHYLYRDRHYFKTVKIPRIVKRWGDLGNTMQEEADANADDRYSLSIMRFIAMLRKKMGLPE